MKTLEQYVSELTAEQLSDVTGLKNELEEYQNLCVQMAPMEARKKELNNKIKSALIRYGLTSSDIGTVSFTLSKTVKESWDTDLLLDKLKKLGKTQYIKEVPDTDKLKKAISAGLEKEKVFASFKVTKDPEYRLTVNPSKMPQKLNETPDSLLLLLESIDFQDVLE